MPTSYRAIKFKGVEPGVFIIVGIDFDEHSIKKHVPSDVGSAKPELRRMK
jgi:hypothetical protein